MATSSKKVRRPVAVTTPVEETQPGDVIELSVTEEVKGNGGSRWVKVGLTSQHRPEETSEEAVDRIQSFVLDGLEAFVKASR